MAQVKFLIVIRPQLSVAQFYLLWLFSFLQHINAVAVLKPSYSLFVYYNKTKNICIFSKIIKVYLSYISID